MKNIAQFGKAKYYQRYGRASCYFLRLVVWGTSEEWIPVCFQRHDICRCFPFWLRHWIYV